jgi:hypothetical protein
LSLKEKYGLDRFLETGTLVGHTAMWAAEHFRDVITVDIEHNIEAEINLSRYERLKQFHVDSGWFLNIYPPEGPTLFWLDAHTNDSCPVLKEIECINRSTLRHVILVDDARLFGDLPAWPTLKEVCEALQDNGRRVTEIIEDVIVATPCP